MTAIEKDWCQRVAEWNKRAGVPQDYDKRALTLIYEEVGEIRDETTSCEPSVLKEEWKRALIGKEICDAIITLLGLAYHLDIDAAPMMRAVLDSNDKKIEHGVTRGADGKILKGPDYVPPDIIKAICDGRSWK